MRLSSSPDGTTLELLDTAGTVVLRYGPFTAVDAAGRLLSIEVLDHIVVGRQRYVSMRERGLGF